MKYKKKMAVAKKKNESKYGSSKKKSKGTNSVQEPVYHFKFGILKELRVSESLQMEMYKDGDMKEFEVFFKSGACFLPRIQRRMTKDDNRSVLALFLKFWEFSPTERSFMIRNASLEFVRLYVSRRSLGKNEAELMNNFRFPFNFLQEISGYLSKEAQNICARRASKLLKPKNNNYGTAVFDKD